MAVVKTLTEVCSPSASRWIHFGLTSADVEDTAYALQFKDAINILRSRLVDLERILIDRVEKYHSHYGASKAAVISLTRAWALELGKYGIRVNAIAPGAIMTRGAKTAPIFRESGDIPEDFLEEQKIKKPLLGRMGNPEDITDMVLYLASESGNYITGAVISVDGGRTLI